MTSEFQDLLNELNRVPSVRGCAVATGDGMTVQAGLQGRFRDDVVSGLASFLVLTTRRAMGESEPRLRRFTIHATHGKLLIIEIGDAYLVVITDQFARMEDVVPEVEDVARRMRLAARID
jgi:predicted regulator of Ras-like GTPase activity (Roadblock/LC7/MglB family)